MACGVPSQCAPRFRTLLRIYLCVPLLLCAAVFVLSIFFFSMGMILLWGIFTGILASAALFLPQMVYDRIFYTRYSSRFKLERGLLVRSITLIPREQIICTRLRRGPLERMLGLSTVLLVTTGGRVTVPGLSSEDAARLRKSLEQDNRHASPMEEQ